MTVQVPEEKIREQVAKRLKSLAGKVKIDGFRPGKVPRSLIEKRYGPGVRDEVLSDLIQSSFNEAVRNEKLIPAGGPTISSASAEEGEGLSYVADFEVMPEFVPMPLEALEVKRYASEVADQDVEAMIQRLRDQRATWQVAERPAVKADRVTISFEGLLGEENFTNGKVENLPVELGSNMLIPGFEDKLIGVSAGANLNFEIEFPSDYSAEKLAGKTARFEVEVGKVEEKVLPELDGEFVRSFGIEDGDVDAFRSDIRENMTREMNRSLKARTKSSVMEVLYERNTSIALPKVLIDQEIEHLSQPQRESAQKQKQALDETSLRAYYEPIARRRVALGLLLNKLIESEKLTVDQARVREAVEDIAASYESPEQVVQWYYNTPEQLRNVQSLVLEDQLVDVVLAKAKVEETQIAFSDLMQAAAQAAS
ncbi:trigger factor [Methylococcus sp. EFPC2]|uniref:trigger factor n=1 Tax=Methylococcus sp. EFPC2 TaxID=2812648 RepID=UPI001F0860EA|nr:trigger factor [Methylococcus sp. EFPC2]